MSLPDPAQHEDAELRAEIEAITNAFLKLAAERRTRKPRRAAGTRKRRRMSAAARRL